MPGRDLAKAHFTNPAASSSGVDLVLTYATDVPLVVAGLLEALAPAADGARLLECGFGTGWLLELLTERFPLAEVFGIDLSATFASAARRAQPRVAIVCADMEYAPFDDGTFDRVASCCALYFAADIEKALAELRRLTAPGGRTVINTVSPDNLCELDAFSRRLLTATPLEDVTARFDMDSGWSPTRAVFPLAQRVEWRGEMRLPDAETFLAYWASFHHREVAEAGPAFLERALRAAEDLCESDGSIRLTRSSGAFIADVR